MGFLLTRRWVLFAIAVALLALLAVRLGEWQFHRLAEREERNGFIAQNIDADPVPVDRVLSTTADVPVDREWLRVTATGEYDDAATVVVRYQTRDGQPGVDLVTPLRTDTGTAVLVDRGWLSTPNTGTVPTDLPPAPAGPVTMTGWVRADGSGSSTVVEDGSTRAISAAAIGETVDYPLYEGFVDAETEEPAPDTELVQTELPDLGNGPHFFYGLQWWFFGLLAVFGFGYLAWDERRRMRRGPAPGKADQESLITR